MILSDIDIQQAIEEGLLEIEPLEKYQIQPASVDLTLGSELLSLTPQIIDFEKPLKYKEKREFSLQPDEFVLGTTREMITVSDNIVGILYGRSSVGRAGLTVENAGVIDPGFKGQITLELQNFSDKKMILKEGMRICQIMFYVLLTESEHPYDDCLRDSKYQNQKGATGSLIHLDREDNDEY